MPIKVGFVSLGCPKNLINTENMIADCAAAGYEIVAEDFMADVMVVNTCAFIQTAKEEAIENVLDIAWLKKHRNLKGIVVAGCLSQRYKEEIYKELPEVDCVIGTGAYGEVVNAVESAYHKKRFSSFPNPCLQDLDGDRVVTTPSHFAYLRIAEGCDNLCTYCVIPALRGKYRSRKIEDIVKEANELASLGVKEICLVAQDTTRYGADLYGAPSLHTLIRAVSEVEGIEWIRTLYCYPESIDDDLIAEFASNPKLVPYIDLPIQHVDDAILKKMNRRGGFAAILSAITRLRQRVPGIALRTTLIVGFPGETREQFEKLLSFVKETRFERLGVFPYSREENTPAYHLPGQVPEKTKIRRQSAIMEAQAAIQNEINQTHIGQVFKVICEGYDQVAESFYGRSQYDCPEIDGMVYFSSGVNIVPGTFVRVKINGVLDYDLTGEAVF